MRHFFCVCIKENESLPKIVFSVHALGVFTHHLFAERLNILFIVSEDNGPELGCYGAPVRTPP